MAPKTHCYVTLSSDGAPTAEACETGPRLVVRPITPTNSAFYVPPYVLGALQYEGFLGEPNLEAVPSQAAAAPVLDGQGFDASRFASAYRDNPTGAPDGATVPNAMAGEAEGGASGTIVESGAEAEPVPSVRHQAEQRILVPGGASRLKPAHRIDDQVEYERPPTLGFKAYPISIDLLL
ncbi:hypothetical protein U0C82_13280 [Fulvimarina sp. 2208YS6-2-32]|uniref:Uncharacterized protein n=2 Tax=Fulvimarina uroteuthidis TaxID=3098149 RepID=A0ABU5I423_9HYPH|nr:hypothetical protein [Fulvimarina sp. 2208YS6-2-32]